MLQMTKLYEVLKEQQEFSNELVSFWNDLNRLSLQAPTTEGYQSLLRKWGGLSQHFMDSSTNVLQLLADSVPPIPTFKTSQDK